MESMFGSSHITNDSVLVIFLRHLTAQIRYTRSLTNDSKYFTEYGRITKNWLGPGIRFLRSLNQNSCNLGLDQYPQTISRSCSIGTVFQFSVHYRKWPIGDQMRRSNLILRSLPSGWSPRFAFLGFYRNDPRLALVQLCLKPQLLILSSYRFNNPLQPLTSLFSCCLKAIIIWLVRQLSHFPTLWLYEPADWSESGVLSVMLVPNYGTKRRLLYRQEGKGVPAWSPYLP
jgi:hypothetical protein